MRREVFNSSEQAAIRSEQEGMSEPAGVLAGFRREAIHCVSSGAAC